MPRLLQAILHQDPVAATLKQLRFPVDRAIQRTKTEPPARDIPPGLSHSEALQTFLSQEAAYQAMLLGSSVIEPWHVVAVFLTVPRYRYRHWFGRMLLLSFITFGRFLRTYTRLAGPVEGLSLLPKNPPAPVTTREASLVMKTETRRQPFLRVEDVQFAFVDGIGRNLTEEAIHGTLRPVFGRDEEIRQMIQILSRPDRHNILLVGEPGVGKTALVEALALHLVTQPSLPGNLEKAIIVELDLNALLSGTTLHGQLEERIQKLIDFLRQNPRVIAFVDEIHTITRAGQHPSSIPLADTLKPLLARGDIRMIGATTPYEYRRDLADHAAFLRRFHVIRIPEPGPALLLDILSSLKHDLEDRYGLAIPEDVLRYAIELSDRYIHDRFYPDKAIDLLEHALGRASLQEGARTSLSRQDLEEALSHQYHIPLDLLRPEEREILKNLEARLKAHIIGQDEAVETVARTIRRARVGLRETRKPFASFLFVGPTGVGKTELAKALAHTLFGDEKALQIFNMAEYSHPEAALQKLLGAAQGYRDAEKGGLLTEAVRRRPYSVLLFDEIEKADPQVYDLFLSILDEGRILDGQGRIADFSHSIIIFTSNAGGSLPKVSRMGFAGDDNPDERFAAYREQVERNLQATFRPEFLARLDHRIIFRPLGEKELTRIADTALRAVKDQLAAKGISLSYDETVPAWLVQKLPSLDYGARPLKRLVQDFVETPLADILLEREGDTPMHIHITLTHDGRLAFH